MKKYRFFFLLFTVLVIVFSSCEREEKNPSIEGNEEDGGGETLPPSDIMLELTLDLTAEMTDQDGALQYEFAEKLPAVALIRSQVLKEVICLPLTLNRLSGNAKSAVSQPVPVPLDGVKAQPDLKWQIRLLAGGQWDATARRLSFSAPLQGELSGRRQTLVMNQPYVSSWQEIATDEKGQFVAQKNGNTSISLKVSPRGTVLVHHIAVCEAEATVELESLRISTRSSSFGGYYDLSDDQFLQEMEDSLDFAWKVDQLDTVRIFRYDKPVLVQKGNELEGEDFLYLWNCLPVGERTAFSVHASGRVRNEVKQSFEDLSVYAAEQTITEGQVVEIGSTLQIEPPAPLDGPIELSTVGNKTKVVADGKDQIEFVVRQNGVDVTEKCVINKKYNGIFDTPIKGHVFTSNTPGTFQFYAMKDGKQSSTIQITAYQGEETDENGNLISGSKFCKNVTLQSGWHDVNKVWNQDKLLCWAAAASNMLQWWLEDFERKGYEIPERVPFGKGSGYSLRIFQEFVACWTDYMNSSDFGISWFLQGGGTKWNNGNGICSPTKKGYVEDGGYFKGVLPQAEEEAFFASEYVISYGAYSNWEYDVKKGIHNDDATMWKNFSALVTRLLDEGAVALSVDSHETTLWGCELKDRLVTRVYIANSDDNVTTLTGYDIRISGGRVHLDKYPGKTNDPTSIIRLTGLKAYEK